MFLKYSLLPPSLGNKNVISNNINPVKFDFASNRHFKNTTQKTILLQTSLYLKLKEILVM